MTSTLYYLFFSCLLVNLCHSCRNFTQQNVTFNATNFEYVLQWSKEHLPSDVLFSVQYKRYGQPDWSLFPECQNIREVYCNLTSAITGDVEDFMEHQYFGRVRALSNNCSSEWVMSKRLNPWDDTFLILPKLSYIEHINSVTIFVSTPSLALKSKDNKSMTVEELYKDQSFEYHLSFFNAEQRNIWQKPQKDNMFEVSGLSPNTEYIGNIYIMIGDKRKSDVQKFVVKTLPDHSLVTLITSLIAIFAVVLGIVMFYFSYKYIQHQAKTPSSLDLKKHTRFPLIYPRKEQCSLCTVGFSPSMFPLNHLELMHSLDQSEKVLPATYASQFQTPTSDKDSPLLPQASFNLQHNNSITESSVHYAGLFEDSNTEYQSNHVPKLVNNASGNSSAAQETFMDKDSSPLNGLQNNEGNLTLFLSFLNQAPNDDTDRSLRLMSSVVVSDAPQLLRPEEHTETYPPVLLSDVFFPQHPENPGENCVLENSLPEYGRSQYRLQQLAQLSFTNGTFHYEQPYMLQHRSDLLSKLTPSNED